MNLNLGSNTKRISGYTNVDIRDVPGVDIVDDVSKLEKVKDESVEHIVAQNILEHFAPDRTQSIVNLWVSKLCMGGSLEISVPDGELIFKRYLEGNVTREEYIGNPWMDVVHSIFGNMKFEREWHGDDAEKYMHHNLFCNLYLKKVMKAAGLHSIGNVDPSHGDNLAMVGFKF
jgi:hypothetical protein